VNGPRNPAARAGLFALIGLGAMAVIVPVLFLGVVLTGGCTPGGDRDVTTLRFWGMGREGEVVGELARDFERENPGIRVVVQQIPWSAAHEKLLTSYVGGSTPDVSQLGNTWIAEFAALGAIRPVQPIPWLRQDDQFPGIWDTNVVDGTAWGVPWYVDTRVLFYRKDLLTAAGYDSMPGTWDGWRQAMAAMKRVMRPGSDVIFLPANEWTQPMIFGLQAGSSVLKDGDTRGAFSGTEFRRGFDFYISLFRDGYASPMGNQEMSNLYQEFARGSFAMYITGPWNLGEFKSRMPDSLQDAWATAPLPGPDGPESGLSTAGGSSLVIYRSSKHSEAAERFVYYLTRPDVQAKFFRLTGSLPASLAAWALEPGLANDERAWSFAVQLKRARSTPKVPEMEQISIRLQEKAEAVIRGAATSEQALANLDREVDTILEKRRWLASRSAAK
jgi:multiple sugar transport system substrate-binding protein